MKYVRKLDRVLLIKVIILPLDKYIIFQLARQHLILSITQFQLDLALKGLNGRLEVLLGRLEVLPGFRLSFPLFSGFCFLCGQDRYPLCSGAPSCMGCRLGSLR
jgi:hypothetical protein